MFPAIALRSQNVHSTLIRVCQQSAHSTVSTKLIFGESSNQNTPEVSSWFFLLTFSLSVLWLLSGGDLA